MYAIRYLSVLCYSQGFTLWHYRQRGLLADVTPPGFFDGAAEMLQHGDMILVSAVDGGRQLFCTKEGERVTVGPLS